MAGATHFYARSTQIGRRRRVGVELARGVLRRWCRRGDGEEAQVTEHRAVVERVTSPKNIKYKFTAER